MEKKFGKFQSDFQNNLKIFLNYWWFKRNFKNLKETAAGFLRNFDVYLEKILGYFG